MTGLHATIQTPQALPCPLPVVYILGAGHSGSTLLAMLLGAHPRICTVGEVKAPAVSATGEYRCSCGRVLTECPFWIAVAHEVSMRGSRFDIADGASDIRRARSGLARRLLRPLHRGPWLEAARDTALQLLPEWRAHAARVQAFSEAVAYGSCSVAGKDVFVDSSKTGLQLKYLLRNPRLDVKVIRLVRDGRGVALSYTKADGLSMAAAANAWKRSNEEAATIVAQLDPDRWFDLRYEVLCSALEPTLLALSRFIGVSPFQPAAMREQVAQHVLGNNRMRLSAGGVRLDEKWRRELSAADLETFDGVAGALNRTLGYR